MHETRVLGERHEFAGQHHTARRMMPAQQRLSADNATALHVYFWLVVKLEFVSDQRRAQ